MADTLMNPENKKFINIDGHIVEEDALRIVEKLKAYDEDLEVLCLDPMSGPDLSDAPFVVIKRTPQGYDRVLEAWTLDDKIVERVWAADCSKHDILSALVAKEEALKKKNEDAWKQTREANKELGAAIIANQKSSFTFKDEKRGGELVVIHESKPSTRLTEKKVFS